MTTRLEQIKARLERTEYLLDPEYEADERELGAAFLNCHEDAKRLLQLAEAAERLVDAKGRALAPEFVALTSAVRAFREGGGEG